MDDDLGVALALVALVVGECVLVLVPKLLGWEAPRDEEQDASLREAMLARERSDPIPRPEFDRLLRRQIPLEWGGPDETESQEAVGRLVSGGGIRARNSGAA